MKKKKEYNLYRIYEENSQTLRQNAPDKRAFLLKTKDGEVRVVRGYRGSGDPFSRRGLPVYDARMLINLVSCGLGKNFLDPFAGVGGIILEAEVSGFRSVSLDIDPVLRYGLAQVSTIHCVSDAQDLPFSTATFDAIATEPPYHENAGPIIIPAFTEMYRVLKDGGRLAILCAGWQANALRREADKLNLVPYLDSFINRKGLDVVVLAWCKGQHQSSHGL